MSELDKYMLTDELRRKACNLGCHGKCPNDCDFMLPLIADRERAAIANAVLRLEREGLLMTAPRKTFNEFVEARENTDALLTEAREVVGK